MFKSELFTNRINTFLLRQSSFPISKDFVAPKRSRGRVHKKRKIKRVIQKKNIGKGNAIEKKMVSSDSEEPKKISSKSTSNNVNATLETEGSTLNNEVKITSNTLLKCQTIK